MKKIMKIAGLLMLVIPFSCEIETSIDPINDNQNNQNINMANYTYISTKIFDQRCALSGCHLNNQMPFLKSEVAYNNIVNKPSSRGLDYIEPGDPDNSYLYLKITGAPGIDGARMPRGMAPLSQTITDSVRAWIEKGALNN